MMQDLIKIGISLLCSLLIGIEREKNDKPAGARSIMLVTLGSTLFGIIGLKLLGDPSMDIVRMFYAPIVGIGFLGGGIIMKKGKGIEGVTTASVLWVCVGIGLATAIKLHFLAVLITLISYLILVSKHLEFKLGWKKRKKI